MMLACGISYHHTSITEAILWSAALLAPIMGFLFLPRLLPLRRELKWAKVRALMPFLWLAGRFGQRKAEAQNLREQLRDAWLGDVQARHAAGAMAAAVHEPRLLSRARIVGELGRAAILVGGLGLTALVLVQGNGGWWMRGMFALSLVLASLVAGWLARIAGDAAGSWAQGLAVTRGWGALGRFFGGAGIGMTYGALAGFTASFAAAWVIIPFMTVATLDAPPSMEVMYALSGLGAVGAIFGGALGAAAVALVTLLARPAPTASR